MVFRFDPHRKCLRLYTVWIFECEGDISQAVIALVVIAGSSDAQPPETFPFVFWMSARMFRAPVAAVMECSGAKTVATVTSSQ
jgi:hypothetical protein